VTLRQIVSLAKNSRTGMINSLREIIHLEKPIKLLLLVFIIFTALLTIKNGAAQSWRDLSVNGGPRGAPWNSLSYQELNDPDAARNVSLIGRWPYGPCDAVFIENNYACIGNGGTMIILDISIPESPQKIGEIVLPGGVYLVVLQTGEFLITKKHVLVR
jgi:hypothetical protein